MKPQPSNRRVWLMIALLAGMVLAGVGMLLTDAEVCYLTLHPTVGWAFERIHLDSDDHVNDLHGEWIKLNSAAA